MNRKFPIVLISVVVLLLAAGSALPEGEQDDSSEKGASIFDGVQLTDHIFGQEITADDVRGKVVFFEYWGRKCGPCVASIPRLIRLQKTYAPSGRFTVVGSHVQDGPDAAAKLCREEGVNFPIYQQLRLANAECGGGIPHAYLFDHEGNIIAEGHPSDLDSKVSTAVKSAGPPPSPMLEGVEIEHFKKYAVKLYPGERISSTITALERESQKDGAEAAEAQAILDSVNGWIESQVAEVEEEVGNRPAHAVVHLEMLSETLRGMDEARQFDEKLDELEDDEDVMDLVKLVEYFDKLQREILYDGPSNTTDKATEELHGMVEEYIEEHDELSEALKNEAEELRDELAAQMDE
jgi:thiol-disulfide isomerase/thioredoxin